MIALVVECSRYKTIEKPNMNLSGQSLEMKEKLISFCIKETEEEEEEVYQSEIPIFDFSFSARI